MRRIDGFIGGKSVKVTSGREADVFNPNTGEVQAKVGLASTGDVDLAVQAAAKAYMDAAKRLRGDTVQMTVPTGPAEFGGEETLPGLGWPVANPRWASSAPRSSLAVWAWC